MKSKSKMATKADMAKMKSSMMKEDKKQDMKMMKKAKSMAKKKK